MSKYHVYGIGNALVDKEFEVEDSFLQATSIEKGLMTLVEQDRLMEILEKLSSTYGLKKRASGGSAANTIIAVSYFGGSTYYSCNVANDETGDFYVNDLKAAGVDTNLGDDREDGTTGRCLVMVTPDAERTMNTYLGITADLSSKHLDEDAIKSSEYLYIEGYLVSSDSARPAAIEAKRIAEANGVKTAFTFSDPAMVQFFKDGLVEMIGGGVDLLFCNEAEALGFCETDQLSDAIEQLKSVAKRFAITLGSKGAIVFDGESLLEVAPHSITAVDSNGAGDMFAGAFLYAITHGYSYQQAGDLASLASAEVVSNFGPRLESEKHNQIREKVLG
ncbi:adenosine kinase [Alkalimarinus sediminis]|uniref:Adenosine kinase n=1 Tax=Alkalimarinus sediminis TaxID=1632866 RepID=A0A9E8HLX1_9ALTE|nr:adenosine kinase [Alkalimarinus sediminis]UZW75762.1 adenosine kinase [Alkalimarinus sediminis]